jgi:hypothetical protein
LFVWFLVAFGLRGNSCGEFYDDDGNVIKYHRASEEVKNEKSSSASIQLS